MTEIEDLLIQYNVDSRNCQLREYYEVDNLWRALRIERDEKRHSAFLAWLFQKDPSNSNSPFFKLLNLIIRCKNEYIDDDFIQLKNEILFGNLQLKSLDVIPEKTISSLSEIRYNDRLDIYAEGEISGVVHIYRVHPNSQEA